MRFDEEVLIVEVVLINVGFIDPVALDLTEE